MDPNHWSALNQQYAAARLSVGPGGVTANPSALPFLEQRPLGLSVLQTPQVANTTLPSAHLPSIPQISYSHGFGSSTMTQILDSLNTGQSLMAVQAPYKTVPVGQPAYNLVETSSVRPGIPEPLRYVQQSDGAKVSLFNTDPHTMTESAHSPSSATPPEASRPYTLSSFLSGPSQSINVPHTATSISSEPRVILESRVVQEPRAVPEPRAIPQSRVVHQEPPPAHSRRPVNTIQKTDFSPQVNIKQRPRQAHSNNYMQEQARSHMLEDMLKTSGPPMPQQPPMAHSNSHHQSSVPQSQVQPPPLSQPPPLQPQHPPSQQQAPPQQPHVDTLRNQRFMENRPQHVTSQAFLDRPQSIGSHSSYSESSPTVGGQQSSYPNSPHTLHHQHHQTEPSSINRQPGAPIANRISQPTYSQYNTGTIETFVNTTSLDTMNYEPVTPPAANQPQNSQGMTLTDFADISANQKKMSMSSGLPQQQNLHVENHLQSNMQGVMSMDSDNPHPVQAIADSTTKPKRGGGKKSGGRGSRSNSTGSRKKKSTPPTSPRHGGEGTTHPYIAITSPDMLPPHSQMGGFSTISADNIGLSHMGHPMSHITAEQAFGQDNPVFMTNTFGNSFMTPKDHMTGMEVPEENNNPLLDPDHEVMFSQTSPKHQQTRTKAEQKQMPTTAVIEDDEFCHLTPADRSAKMLNNGHGNPHGGAPPAPQPPPSQPADIPDPPKSKSKDSSFQSSFLSFLQGKKPETLSSVTNSTITQKPEMPKYVPEPRPPKRIHHVEKQSPPQERKEPVVVTQPKTKTVNKPKAAPSTPAGAKAAKPVTDVVTFSDDDDDLEDKEKTIKLNKTLTCLLTDLADEPKQKKSGPKTLPMYKIISTTPAATPPASKSRGRQGSTSKKCSKKKAPISADQDEPPLLHKVFKEEDVLPMREKSSRKAKEKTEQKKKSKKKSKKYSDSEDSEDIATLSEDADSDNVNYDSDKDPVWMPFAQDFTAGQNDSDDQRTSKGKGSKRLKSPTGRAPKRPRPMSTSSPKPGTVLEPPSPTKPRDITEDTLAFLSDDEEPPHLYEKGNFVIDRRDLTKYDSYPVWKIDAGRLLQKFELVHVEGKVLHRSLSTYSSWTDNIRERYKAIAVDWVQRGRERDQDLVRVMDEYIPLAVDESLEEDPNMQAFNVYVQILVSQALEPGFISAISTEEDDYYSEPSAVIDGLLAEKKNIIAKRVKWTANLQESVEKYPFISMGEKEQTPTLQAARPLFKAIQLSGRPYSRSSLEERRSQSPDGGEGPNSKDFLIGHLTAQLVSIYHKLHHFKFTLLKRCKSKVCLLRSETKTDQSDLLDQCLQNRSWVHRLFHNFQRLLQKASDASKLTSGPLGSSSEPPAPTTPTAAGTRQEAVS